MKKSAAILAVIVWISLLIGGQSTGQEKSAGPEFDILVRGGLVYDGSLATPVRSDIAVRDGRIAGVGKGLRGSAGRVIDAAGLIVTPGFIDMHTHVDDGMYFPEGRSCLASLVQGVTTVVVGQCGSSAWPIFEEARDLIARWNETGIGPNAALLVGHGTVRQLVMGMEDRPPTPEELEKMKAIVREAMEQGAWGMSTGLVYEPGSFAKTDEVVELVKVIAPFGGIYHSHVRGEGAQVLDSYKEAIAISEQTGVPAHISHMKVLGRANWGKAREACALVEEARAKGLKITGDQYPYRFANTTPYRPLIQRATWIGPYAKAGLRREDLENVFDHLPDAELIEVYKKVTPFFPLSPSHEAFLNRLPRKRLLQWVVRNVVDMSSYYGPENLRERTLFLTRLADPGEGPKLRQGVRTHIDSYLGPENFYVGVCVDKRCEGKSLAQVAALMGKSVEDAAIELELMGARCVPFAMSDEDIEFIIKKEYVATGSDGILPTYGLGLPHVRSYGTFLDKIEIYALGKKAVSLAHAIRSQTSLPADIMGWPDRGRIAEGAVADIVILDIKALRTPSSISAPHQLSRGVKHLLVNGTLAIDSGAFTGTLAGRVLIPKRGS
jgi:N-acyl-D-aspartate/D-glutamate deacylase